MIVLSGTDKPGTYYKKIDFLYFIIKHIYI